MRRTTRGPRSSRSCRSDCGSRRATTSVLRTCSRRQISSNAARAISKLRSTRRPRRSRSRRANGDAAFALIRVGGRVGRWDAGAKVVLERAAIAGGPDETLLHALEDAASAHAGWDALTTAFEAAIGQHGDLAREAARDLEARL